VHITHFKSAPEFRAWLRKHHAAATELLPGFYRKDSGLGGITCAEALDEALCHGWIDGVRRKVDEVTVRHPLFATRPSSIWSNINVRLPSFSGSGIRGGSWAHR